jgi:hypothetical protein
MSGESCYPQFSPMSGRATRDARGPLTLLPGVLKQGPRMAALCVSLIVLSGRVVSAQEGALQQRLQTITVFVDCAFSCDLDFFRTEIPVVNYARDRKDADVHLLLTSEPTAGGTEYRVSFIGQTRFAGVDVTLTYLAAQAATDDERRNGIVKTLKLGLVRYIAETESSTSVDIRFREMPVEEILRATKDPWNLWVFRGTFGGTVTGETATQGRAVRLGVSANHTGERWKLTFAFNGNYRDDSFALSDTETFESMSRTSNATALLVRAVSQHWSIGLNSTAVSSTYLNFALKTRVAPGVEYNFFPYAESSRRMLTVQYTGGVGAANYREETIFRETSERLIDHRLATSLTLLQPWGTSTAEVAVSQLLTRSDQYNITAFGSINVRLFRGLSANVYSNVSRTHDQFYLPLTDASTEEILVRERQLATAYRYSVNFGLTYTFGSKFNNVVNRRFGVAAEESAEF